MKVNGYMNVKGAFARMLLWVMVLAGVTTANAQTKENPEVWRDGGSYEVAFLDEYYAQFTAPEDGTLTLSYYKMDPMVVCTDAEFETRLSPTPDQIGWSPKTFYIEMTAGTTYYFSTNGMAMNSGYVTVAFGEPFELEVQTYNPEVGSTISISTGAQISYTFNDAVKVSGVTLTAGSTVRNITPEVYMSSVILNLKDELMSWMAEGTLKGGDEFTVTVKGICRASDESSLYGGDGTLSATYVIGNKPLLLTETLNTPGDEDDPKAMNTFLSYFTPDAEQNFVRLTFDGELEEGCASVTLMYGNMEAEDPSEYYSEVITDVVYEGNTLTIPLYGVLRTPAVMVTSATDYGVMTLMVRNLRGTDGQYVFSPGSGSLGSFSYQYNYKELLPKTISVDWSPVGGSLLKDGARMELWVSDDFSGLSYDGVLFSYTVNGEEKSVLVEKDDLTVEPDPEDATATIITLRVPELEAALRSEITVSLAGLTSVDGYDYAPKFVKTYLYGGDGTGVDAVLSDDASRMDVYGLDGVLVLRNAGREDLKGLKKGIYVVSGRKVVIE